MIIQINTTATQESAVNIQKKSSQQFSRRCHAAGIAQLFSFVILYSAFCPGAGGHSYSIDWYKIAGGGGTSTDSNFSICGTIGQPDASGAMSGGNFSMTGGLWSLIAVVPTSGLPNLLIAPNGPNSVQVRWPATGSYTLQQNSNLSGGAWTPTGYAITNGMGTNFCTVTPLAGKLFFRLANP